MRADCPRHRLQENRRKKRLKSKSIRHIAYQLSIGLGPRKLHMKRSSGSKAKVSSLLRVKRSRGFRDNGYGIRPIVRKAFRRYVLRRKN